MAQIFAVSHFQNNIEMKKLLRGGRVADPFLVARAKTTGSTLVTMETLKPNAADIGSTGLIPYILDRADGLHYSLTVPLSPPFPALSGAAHAAERSDGNGGCDRSFRGHG